MIKLIVDKNPGTKDIWKMLPFYIYLNNKHIMHVIL